MKFEETIKSNPSAHQKFYKYGLAPVFTDQIESMQYIQTDEGFIEWKIGEKTVFHHDGHLVVRI